eukprot:1108886-Pleurochrysis_carterae.AAC.2
MPSLASLLKPHCKTDNTARSGRRGPGTRQPEMHLIDFEPLISAGERLRTCIHSHDTGRASTLKHLLNCLALALYAG